MQDLETFKISKYSVLCVSHDTRASETKNELSAFSRGALLTTA